MNWTAPTYDAAIEIREHFDETGWRRAMEAICAREKLDPSSLHPFPTGSDVVWGTSKAVVKLTPPRFRPELENEVRALEHVAGQLRVATPEPLSSGELDGWPYVVLSRVAGVAVGSVWSGLDAVERKRLAGELGELTRELHALPPAPGSADEWDEFWARCRADVPERQAQRGAEPAWVERIAPFLAQVGELPCRPLVFAHTELLDQHVLVHERGGRVELAALIDFADSRGAPCEYEFPAPVEFVFRGEPGTLRAYLSGYGVPAAELGAELAERYLAWGLCHRFGSLPRMLAALAGHKPAPATLPELARSLYDMGT